MKVALSGGERGAYRSVLLSMGVPRIAMNLTQFNIPKTKVVDLAEMFNGSEVVLYTSDGDEDVHRYDQFLREHADSLSLVVGRPDYDGEWLGEKYYPLWNDPEDTERLAHLCQKYGRAVISDRAITPKTLPRVNQLKQRWGASLVGITSKTDVIEAVEWDLVIVSSWTSVVRYGETQVWDGHRLFRYPAQKKDSARSKHRADIVRLGVNYEEVVDGDVNALQELAIKSWLSWEQKTLSGSAYHPLGDDDELEFDSSEKGGIATIPPSEVTPTLGDSEYNGITTTHINGRHEDAYELLPGIGVETVTDHPFSKGPDGDETADARGFDVQVVRTSDNGLRNCDSCYLASRCPAFTPHVECAYKIPVVIRTSTQLSAVLNAIIEMQAARVMFAKFGEDLEGQGADATVSAEMDRLFRLVKDLKEIDDSRDMVKINVEARGSSGVLSRIFGDQAAEKATALSSPVQPQELDAFIEGEVLGEET